MIPARIKTVLLGIGEESSNSPGGLKSTLSPVTKINSPKNISRFVEQLPSEISLNKIRKINVMKLQNEEDHIPQRDNNYTDVNVTEYREKGRASQMSQLRDEQQISFDPFTQTQFSGIENVHPPKADQIEENYEDKKKELNKSTAISHNEISYTGTHWTPKLKQSNQFNMKDLLQRIEDSRSPKSGLDHHNYKNQYTSLTAQKKKN